MREEKEPYEALYESFMKDYKTGIITSENVGELVARLAGYYPNYNAHLVKAERGYALVSRDEVLKTDETTGKPISSAKADTLANASVEATAFKTARMHIQNLEMLIQSAKALQRGLIQEMNHSNL
jgi:inorganic triphosphatase YgiF